MLPDPRPLTPDPQIPDPQIADPQIPDPPAIGLLIVGHGTRDRAGVAEFWRLVERIKTAVAERAVPLPVEGAFLELVDPPIAEGLNRLLARGVGHITVAPLLLFKAGHAKRDIPDAVDAALAELASPVKPTIRMTLPFECNSQVLRLSTRRFDEALAGRAPVDRSQTLLLMVSRGSSDPAATASMRNFAALRAQHSPVARAEVCFVAVAEPTLADGLALAGASGARLVVVQPHLLFSGLVLNDIRVAVETARRQFPDTQWLMTEHLGPEEEIVQALLMGLGV